MIASPARTEWWFAGALTLAAALLIPWMGGGALLHTRWPVAAIALAVTGGFALIDRFWIPVEFGAAALMLLASEIVLVPGVLYLPVWALLSVRGFGVVLDDVRGRGRPSLTAMNLATTLLETSIVVAVVHRVIDGGVSAADVGSLQRSAGGAAVLGCAVASLAIGVLLTGIMLPARGGTIEIRGTALMIAVSAVSSTMFAGVALVGLAVAAVSPLLLVPLVAVGVLGVGLARRWVPAHQHLTRTERLYEFSRLLAVTSATDADTLADILDEVGLMLAAHAVELVAPIALGPDQAIRVTTRRVPLQLVELDARTIGGSTPPARPARSRP